MGTALPQQERYLPAVMCRMAQNFQHEIFKTVTAWLTFAAEIFDAALSGMAGIQASLPTSQTRFHFFFYCPERPLWPHGGWGRLAFGPR